MSRPIQNPQVSLQRLKDDSWVDEALAPLSAFVEMMSIASTAGIYGSEFVPSIWVENLGIELPFEMDTLVEESGRVRLAGGPPTQYTDTTFLPIFHRIRLTVTGEIYLG